jgi:hypothetical protein
MDEAQFLEMSRSFKASRERLLQLPKLIDSLMVKELNLRRIALINRRNNLNAEIEKAKEEREKLQTEMFERKALVPILRKQLVDASRQIWNTKTKNEADRIDELRKKFKETKLTLEDNVTETIKSAAMLWGTEQMSPRLMEYVLYRVEESLRYVGKFPNIGIEKQLLEASEQYKKDYDTLCCLLQASTDDDSIKLPPKIID